VQEVKAAEERARLLIEQAEKLGEHLDDPLLLFSVLYGAWVANSVDLNGDASKELASQFMSFAEKQGEAAPLIIGHRLMGFSLTLTGQTKRGQEYLDSAIALYDPTRDQPTGNAIWPRCQSDGP
jgi:hypothetical protein